MTRGIPRSTDSNVVKTAQAAPVDMPITGSLDGLLRPDQDVIVAEGPELGDYAAELAFMEEKVEVVVHESTDKNASMLVDLYCNGVPQRFIRGMPLTVKRKFLEILARARETSITTTVSAQGQDGEPVNRINKHTAVRYPFSVVYDPNPKGREWLKQTLQSS